MPSSRVLDVFGSSHQIWHACVLMAAVHHFGVVTELWRASGGGQQTSATVAATAVSGVQVELGHGASDAAVAA